MNRIALISIFALSSLAIQAQDYGNEFCTDTLKFINFDRNQIDVFDTAGWKRFMCKLHDCGKYDTAKTCIVHIGDSHLQADFFSGELRRCLHRAFNQTPPARGLIFPYAVAGTNNPWNYSVNWTGEWTNVKGIDQVASELGLSGMEISTSDTTASLTINVADNALPGYGGNRLLLFCGRDKHRLIPIINGKRMTDCESSAIACDLSTHTDSITLTFTKSDSSKDNSFTLQGLALTTGKGVEYDVAGINGARVSTYLRYDNLKPQLELLAPDLVIVSLGTNDSYGQRFDSERFESQLEKMICIIRDASPKCTILLTTPGNNKINGELHNQNVHICARSICRTAERLKCSVWDFNSIMGDDDNTDLWREANLLRSDFLHLTSKGYELQARMLFNALIIKQ